MKKSEVIQKLVLFVNSEECRWRGQKEFVLFFIEYLGRNKLPCDKWKFSGIEEILDNVIVDALFVFIESEEIYAIHYRELFVKKGGKLPTIEDFDQNRVMMFQTCVEFMIIRALGEKFSYVVENARAKFFSDYENLNKVFRRFVTKVYMNGLFDLINDSSLKGSSCEVGEITIFTFTMCARTQIQFNDKDKNYVAYLTSEDDTGAYSAGLKSTNADLYRATSMINQVINHWPSDKEEQIKLFIPNKDVTLDVVSALRTEDEEVSVASR